MAPNYALSKVYVIRNTVNPKMYIGSTTCTLSKRMVQHRSDAKTARPGYDFPLYVAMRELGIDKFYIELLADFPCERKEQLNAEEGRRIRELDTLATNGYNARIAGRSIEQYHADHAEATKSYKRDWALQNRDTINARRHEAYMADLEASRIKAREKTNKWNAANRSKCRERGKAYAIANKDKISEKRKERRASAKAAAQPTPASE